MEKTDPSLHLVLDPFSVYIAQYAADISIPPTIFQSDMPFLSVTRSPAETTLLYSTSSANDQYATVLASLGLPEPKNHDGPYAVLRMRGPLDLRILNEITTPLRIAKVPIYAVSTWNTDYVLVPSTKVDEAVDALKGAGWTFGM